MEFVAESDIGLFECYHMAAICAEMWIFHVLVVETWFPGARKVQNMQVTERHRVTRSHPPLFFSMWTRKMYKGNTAIISYNVITTSKGRSSHHMCLSYLVMALDATAICVDRAHVNAVYFDIDDCDHE